MRRDPRQGRTRVATPASSRRRLGARRSVGDPGQPGCSNARRTPAATSAGDIMGISGTDAAPGRRDARWQNAVRTGPGVTSVTRIRRQPSSLRRHRIRARELGCRVPPRRRADDIAEDRPDVDDMAPGRRQSTLSTVKWTTASTSSAVIRSISDAGWLLTAAGQHLTPLAREVGALVIGTRPGRGPRHSSPSASERLLGPAGRQARRRRPGSSVRDKCLPAGVGGHVRGPAISGCVASPGSGYVQLEPGVGGGNRSDV